MQKVVDIIYITTTNHTSLSGFSQLLAELREKVCAHLKEGWALNGGITVDHVTCTLTIIQPMVKYEQEQEQEQLPVRRKTDSS